jgi:hypothetical protein
MTKTKLARKVKDRARGDGRRPGALGAPAHAEARLRLRPRQQG